MCAVVRESIAAGAVGLATSFAPTHLGIDGKPVPSRLAELSEFEAMARVLGEQRRGVVAVTPGQGFFREIYDFQRRVGVPVTYTALLAIPGFWQMGSKLNDEETAKGADVWPQVSCRKITMQLRMSDPFQFNQAPSFAALMGKPREARLAAYRDRAWRERALAELAKTALPPRWDSIEVAESERHAALLDRRVADVAQQRGATPFDVMLDLSLEENLETRFRCIQSNDDEAGIAHLLRSQHVVLGLSDAGAHVGQLCDAPLPTDLLGNWVRERAVLPLEEAVRKLTSEPAALFRFEGGGVLRPGAFADVAVFDPATVAPGPLRRVRDFPADADRLTADQPEGMRHVLVNGTPIRSDGKAELGARPGRLVAQGRHA
jgi:N-acyl-D-aspartate/D-glutamate deacylase